MKRSKIIIILCIAFISILVSGFSCMFSPDKVKAPKDYPRYDKLWKKVDSFIENGLPQSALKITDSIYQLAKTTENHPQFIRAMIYKIKLSSDFEEEFIEKSASDLKTEIASAQTPAKQIMQSMLAEIYWRYYSANRYKFHDRTQLLEPDMNDMQTWDLNTLTAEVIKNYRFSLEPRGELITINLKEYDAILQTSKESKTYRSSLYDFLAHRAIDFFMNDEASVSMPAYHFEVDKEDYFSTPAEFVNLGIKTKDTLSLSYYALNILQQLESLHLNESGSEALTDVYLKRMNFVHRKSILSIKDSLQIEGLKTFERQILSDASSARVSYQLAKAFKQRGQQYDPLAGADFQWDIKRALEKCEEAIKRFPKSVGAKNCRILLDQIKLPEYKIQLEAENLPDQATLALVNYKNTPKLYFRILHLDFEKDRELKMEIRDNKLLMSKYLSYPVEKQWSQDFPDMGDYQSHAAEIKVPALPVGYYVMLASDTPDFAPDTNLFSYQYFWNTHLSFVSQETEKRMNRFFVLDRQTGQALKDVKVEMFYRTYDYRSRGYQYEPGNTFISDKQGAFTIPATTDNNRPNSYFLKLSLKDDLLITENQFYQQANVPIPDRKTEQTFFYTDRAIYRPGQTIYFKGIVLEKEKNAARIKKSLSTTVEFRDANYQKISEMKLTTNEYGSFSGSFIAPAEGLNGQMTLRNTSGSQTIRVEEYKRPTFEVTFEPIEGSYKLGQTVEVTGQAKAFAGSVIDGADVNYRVVRSTYFPWLYDFGYFNYFPTQTTMEITNGVTQTGSDGKFMISFEAIPDYSVSRKYQPAFNYRILVDVRDITNEVQSGETHVYVSEKALQTKLNVADFIDAQKLSDISFRTTNLNGKSVSSKGKITFSRLEEKSRMTRQKLWVQADVFTMTAEDYHRTFPLDAFSDENNLDKRNVEAVIKTMNFSTPEDSVFSISSLSLKPGKYKIEAEANDEFGSLVKEVKYITVFDAESKSTPENEPAWFHLIKNTGQAGEQASFLLGSRYAKVQVLFEIYHKGKRVHSEWIKLNNEQKQMDIPLLQSYTDPATISLLFVKENRIYPFSFSLSVPDISHMLDMEFTTFRDKLQPGQDEEWSIKILGAKGEKLAAELLVGMYDASLDQFAKNSWSFNPGSSSYFSPVWFTGHSFGKVQRSILLPHNKEIAKLWFPSYDQLNWFGFNYQGPFFRGGRQGMEEDVMYDMAIPQSANGAMEKNREASMDKTEIVSETVEPRVEENVSEKTSPSIRRDFKETAFFFPDLKTDAEGNVSFSFKVPESLTSWDLMGFAHTADLKYGFLNKKIITQKELMVIPNPPRFFRKGDRIDFTAKVVNLSEDKLSGTATLQLFNIISMEDITGKLMKGNNKLSFETTKGESQSISWTLNIPEEFDMISYRIVASAGNKSDGEEKPIPVLSNRMLVTESLPLSVKGGESKTFRFEKLIHSNTSEAGSSLRNHQLTLEFSSNPAWYAVQALPYLMETSNESADAAFTRFYANAIGEYLVNKNPKIKRVFDAWKARGKEAFMSNLEKNQDLKRLILSETPWVRDAQNESERKHRVAQFFDINAMVQQKSSAIRKLVRKQSPSGGWGWFKGMPDNRYITQQIVTGFGHLKTMGVMDPIKDESTRAMLIRAIRATDQMLKDDYERLFTRKTDTAANNLNNSQIQYLYARSVFMKDVEPSRTFLPALNYYKRQAANYWVQRSNYTKGMIALALTRFGSAEIPDKIMASIKEHALYSDEMGMYWRNNQGGYYWYQAPIETQALLIEAFAEVSSDQHSVELMKTWLLKQKQVQDWRTPKATAEAIYALLIEGTDWLQNDQLADISLGGESIHPLQSDDTKVEAGTGYFKTSWPGMEISPDMGIVTVKNNNASIAWGALYGQYFEQLDKISFAKTPLSIIKQLFLEKNTASGPVLESIGDGRELKSGDKIKVRIEIRVDRDMEFVHLKDMRAAAFEPVSTLSGYSYRGGLGYYQSTLDASTDFFFDRLPKGSYVFEYDLRATQKGNFSNGITTIQCMYAPEFTSHSEGVRVEIR